MAENYIAKEAVEFLAELLLKDKTAGIPYTRDTVDRPTSGAHVWALGVLEQQFLRFRKDQKWLTDKQNKTFAD
ncbi:hypothetical protein ACLB2K_073781 [Fragaria x ananassa]